MMMIIKYNFIIIFIIFVLNVQSVIIRDNSDNDNCQYGTIEIAESIPIGIELNTNLTTHNAWMDLITNAKSSIDLGFFYFSLTNGALYNPIYGGQLGMDIYNAIIDAHNRGIYIRIVQNLPSQSFPDNDTQAFSKLGIEVRSIDWESLVGAGILHTKLMLVDQSSGYLGSTNADWTSLAQVKELGIVLKNCQTMIQDTQIAFEQYWNAAEMTSLPTNWGIEYQALFNNTNMASLLLNSNTTQQPYNMFLAVSPPEFVSSYRTGDINALVSVIENAKKSICIAVMDYTPTSLYNDPNTFWPVIDNALRAAAFNNDIDIRLLISHWNHTDPIIPQFLHSLNQVTNIQVKWFVLPDFSTNPQIPFTRVGHAKYMVSDQQSYVGTSNWSSDYFTNTGGLSYNIINDDFTNQLQSIFNRDWNSQYTEPITNY